MLLRMQRNGPQALPKGFMLGVNYPWHHYGQDFGTNSWGHTGVSDPAARQSVDADFAYLEKQGVTRIRWFLFCDGRAGIRYATDGSVIGLDDFVFPDMDAAIELAARHHIQIVFVFFDFHLLKTREVVGGVQVGGRSTLIADAKLQRTLVENAIVPVLKRYAHEKQIIAWEVINEPEWSMQLGPFSSAAINFLHRMHAVRTMDEVPAPIMVDFVKRVAALVHADTQQWVTLGSAGGKYLSMWKNCSLDFLEVHYYGSLMPWFVQPAQSFNSKVPILVGEFPSSNKLPLFLDDFLMNGYSGAFIWSLNATDRYSNFRGLAPRWHKWQTQHEKQLAR